MAQDRLWPLPSTPSARSHEPTPADADRRPSGPAGVRTVAPAAQRRWRSSELFGSAQEVEIEHGDAVYRLRLTALGKLIMTK